LGKPTTPIFSDVFTRPHLAAPAWPSVVSTFFGGILRATSHRAVGGAALREGLRALPATSCGES
jgi:hypothetical protein